MNYNPEDDAKWALLLTLTRLFVPYVGELSIGMISGTMVAHDGYAIVQVVGGCNLINAWGRGEIRDLYEK